MKKGEKTDLKLSAPAIRMLPDEDREGAKGDVAAKQTQPGNQSGTAFRC